MIQQHGLLAVQLGEPERAVGTARRPEETCEVGRHVRGRAEQTQLGDDPPLRGELLDLRGEAVVELLEEVVDVLVRLVEDDSDLVEGEPDARHPLDPQYANEIVDVVVAVPVARSWGLVEDTDGVVVPQCPDGHPCDAGELAAVHGFIVLITRFLALDPAAASRSSLERTGDEMEGPTWRSLGTSGVCRRSRRSRTST